MGTIQAVAGEANFKPKVLMLFPVPRSPALRCREYRAQSRSSTLSVGDAVGAKGFYRTGPGPAFDAPNYVHLTTLRVDGSPRSGWPCGVGLEGDRILVCTDDRTWKAKDMRHDPRVSLSVVDLTVIAYRHGSRRRGKSWTGQARCWTAATMDPIAQKYTSEPFPYRGPSRRPFRHFRLRSRRQQPGLADPPASGTLRTALPTTSPLNQCHEIWTRKARP